MVFSTQKIATSFGFLSILLWSLNALLTVYIIRLPAFQALALFFSISFISSFTYVAVTGKLKSLKQPFSVWILGILGLFLSNFFYVSCFKHAPAAQVDLIFYIWPMIAVLISPILLKEKFSQRTFLGSLLGLSAVAVVVTGDAEGGSFFAINPEYFKGYAMAFLGALMWALYNVLSRLMKKNPVEMVTIFFGGTALLASISHVATETFVMPNTQEICTLIIMGLSTQGAAYFGWDFAVKKGNFKLLKTVAYAVPVLSIGLLVVFGKAEASFELAIATLLILVASVLSGTNLIPFLGENLALLKERLSVNEQNIFFLNPLERKAELFTLGLGETIKKESLSIKLIAYLLVIGPPLYIGGQAMWDFYFDELSFFCFSSASAMLVAVLLTVVGALSGGFLWFFYRLYRNRAIHQVQQKYYDVCEKICDFLVAARNETVHTLDPREREIFISTLILQNPEAGETAVEQAVLGLTQNKVLAEAAKKIETMRFYGFVGEIEKILLEIGEELRQSIHELKAISEKASWALSEYFQGHLPPLDKGVRRSEGFIERILTASENNDDHFMTLDDVNEVLKFALEILSGRELSYLQPKFLSKEETFKRGEKRHELYSQTRAALLRRNNRLRAILDLLPSSSVVHINALAMPKVVDLVHENIEIYIEFVTQKKNLFLQNPTDHNIEQLTQALKVFFEVQTLYHDAVQEGKQARRLFKSMTRFLPKADGEELNRTDWVLTKRLYQKRAIQVQENNLHLDNADKNQVIERLYDLFKNVLIKRHGRKIYLFADIKESQIDDSFLKRIAIEVLNILNDFLPLTSPNVQRAIESSNAINLSALQTQWGVRKIVGWISTLSQRTEKNKKTLAFGLANSLTHAYQLRLNDQMIDYLVEEFQVDRAHLEAIEPPASRKNQEAVPYLDLSLPLLSRIEQFSHDALEEIGEH